MTIKSTYHFVNNLGFQNVLEVNEPVLIVRLDDGPVGPKHVALYVLLMVTINVLEENINTLFKYFVTSSYCIKWKTAMNGKYVATSWH
jgi:ABC-type long-subunit fatty acid transport system fused permease/ATPase subunit